MHFNGRLINVSHNKVIHGWLHLLWIQRSPNLSPLQFASSETDTGKTTQLDTWVRNMRQKQIDAS
jgi:hypothetical protein